MKPINDFPAMWENDEARVDVHYSAAGVSTTVILTSKFTGKILIADVGDGTLRDLLSMFKTEFVEELDMICITHGHFDHMGGLHSLLGFMRDWKRGPALDILTPAGSIEVLNMVRGFREAYRDTTSFRIRLQEVRPGVGFDTDFFKLNVFDVEHFGMENPTDEDVLMPAVGYRIRVGDTIISYTGDTRMCESVKDLVRDADLAIIEATLDSPPDSGHRVHLTLDEAKKLASLAKDAMLIHRIPKIAGASKLPK